VGTFQLRVGTLLARLGVFQEATRAETGATRTNRGRLAGPTQRTPRAADSSRTRGGSSAHREGEGCRRHPSIKRVDELLVCNCAAVACRADELGGARLCARAMGKNISRLKQVTDWVARLEKLEQMLACSGVRQQLARAASLDRQ
jgi:hypothetical protein